MAKNPGSWTPHSKCLLHASRVTGGGQTRAMCASGTRQWVPGIRITTAPQGMSLLTPSSICSTHTRPDTDCSHSRSVVRCAFGCQILPCGKSHCVHPEMGVLLWQPSGHRRPCQSGWRAVSGDANENNDTFAFVFGKVVSTGPASGSATWVDGGGVRFQFGVGAIVGEQRP